MKRVFADTSFFVAVLNQRDRYHAKALELAGTHENFVTTDFVMLELGNAFSRADERLLFLSIVERITTSAQATIIEADRGLLQLGLELFRQRMDKNWSLTDCISFVVMERHGLREALTADRHFAQAGFDVLMRV